MVGSLAAAPTIARAPFHPLVADWFERAFAAPTPAQAEGWPAIARGEHTLILAPTGSGKTLAAFLWGLNRLIEERLRGEPGTRLLYVSPLKALNYDVERNLRAPLAGLADAAGRRGIELPPLSVAVRTGDTPQAERARMLREPPDVLITTPESLYLLLTSRGASILEGAGSIIVDEIHAVAATKRGAHLALSLERLDRLAGGGVQRIGLSATQRPLSEVARFLGGQDAEGRPRPVTVVDAGRAKELDLEVRVPVEDMRELANPAAPVAHDVIELPGTEGPRRSIWPAMYPEILELVRAHRSTIVFVNNRRLAERLALRLNELAEEEVARAHHGSLAREQRLLIEEELKAGRLPCLVATSSLELGVDMGAVDLVVQVESPRSVARGIQRIGRAGHQVDAVSRGRIFPKYRGDLLECAAVVSRMREGAIEETRVPRLPLDVLAQQVVAAAAVETLGVDEILGLARGAYPFAELSAEQLEGVLDMLAGRYPSDEFAELRPRLVWDRVAGTVRGRDGARALAVQNAGTIPDRGLFGVYLLDGRSRVGELDEEMVYEARSGQTFMLGASTWRIEEITRDRVLVSPAPGAPGAVPFWKGEGVGRPAELGAAVGRLTRELAAAPPERAAERLRRESAFDGRAARNLVAYLQDQAAATGTVPSDTTVVVERFRDEIGDWRLCVLTPFGGRVHAPWALALGARLREATGSEAHVIWGDDGIAAHLPDADEPPSAEAALIDPDELEELVIGELGGTALFGARFRENAARALLIPRRRPGRRTPLWQQRLKASSLLQVARRFGSFPVILETYRECLNDWFDLPALRELLRRDRLARAVGGRGRDGDGVALRRVAALRVRRLLHVRGRHAGRRAARAGARPQPRPAARAARPGGAPGPHRPGRAGRAGGRPAGALGAGAGARRRRPARPAATGGRPAPGRGPPADDRARPGRGLARGPGLRAPGLPRPPGRRGALDRRRGGRPLPRRPRGDAALGAPGGVPRARAGGAARPRGPLRPHARALPGRRGGRAPGRRPGPGRDPPAGPGGGGRAGARRAPARRLGPRVVRRRGPAPPAPGQPRGAAPRDRAGRAAGPRPLPARLAAGRPAARRPRGGPPAGGHRPAAGTRAARRPVGGRGLPPAPRELQPDLAGPARRRRRDRLGGRRGHGPGRRPGGALPAPGRRPVRPAPGRSAARGRGGRGAARRPGRRRRLLGGPGRRRPRAGRGRLRRPLGPGVGRRGDQRPLEPAARRPAPCRACAPRPRASAAAGRAGPAPPARPRPGAGRSPPPSSPGPPRPASGAGPWPSCCSSATAC